MSDTPLLSPPTPAPIRFASWLAGLKQQRDSLLAWAFPGEPVLLLHADGSQAVWRGGVRLPEATGAKAPRFVAIQIPEDMVLRRSMVLPRMSQAHGADAMLLEVASNNPFPADDLAWGAMVREPNGSQTQVELAMTSRRHVTGFMQQRWPELAAAEKQPEVWTLSGQNLPIVLRGFGEVHRLDHAAIERRWNWALAGIILALAAMAAVTPTIQLRLRVQEAVAAYDAVLRRVAPLVRKRDELALMNDKVRSLELIAAERVDPAGVMEYLTRILPDDTYLYSLDIQKTKITASGHTVDASALLRKLSLDPRLKNVKAPMAVTRLPGATKEAFIIEFSMEPQPAALNPTVGAVAGSAPVAALPASIAAPAAVPTAPAVASTAASAPVPPGPIAALPVPAAVQKPAPPAKPPAGSSPFVIGGSR